ncbi:MAG TPA: hypothetical protein VKX17_27690 [Planctomycetota bacterium]|nr:hypothetical protein [Planctomycetota bacterium]
MHYRAILLALLVCAAARARAESPDPSYEPDRYAKPSVSKPKSDDKKSKAADKTVAADPAARAEVEASSGPRVKYILDGKPIYEGDLPVTTPPGINANADSKKADSKKRAAEVRVEAAVETPSEPRVKYILDGKPVYDGNVPVAVQAGAELRKDAVTPPVFTPAQPAVPSVDDLTADKPGSPAAAAAQQQALLTDMPAPAGLLSSRAKDCYRLLAELKTNVETISRCLDNRGKENARLIRASDQAVENLSDFAAIWPRRDDFIEACASAKRDALLLSSELSQTPWRWKEVRWSFDMLLANARSFRVYAKVMAENEKPPVAVTDEKGRIVLDKKTGKPVYRDVPDDPPVDKATAIAEMKAKAAREELQRVKRKESAHDDADKNRLETDLSHVK